MKKNIIEKSRGEHLCTTCDFDFSLSVPHEVEAHLAHHRAFLDARRRGLAPAPRQVRDRLRREGQRAVYDLAAPLPYRVDGAEMFLAAKYADHLAGALIHEAPLPGYDDFVRRKFLRDGFDQWFPPDVASELLRKYA